MRIGRDSVLTSGTLLRLIRWVIPDVDDFTEAEQRVQIRSMFVAWTGCLLFFLILSLLDACSR